jgi:hypothetical protein
MCAAVICSVLTAQSFARSEDQELRKVVATGAGMNEDQALKNAFTIAGQQMGLPRGLVGRRRNLASQICPTIGLHQTMATAVLVAFCHFLRSSWLTWPGLPLLAIPVR